MRCEEPALDAGASDAAIAVADRDLQLLVRDLSALEQELAEAIGKLSFVERRLVGAR